VGRRRKSEATPAEDPLDPIWKALSDPTRRAILYFVRDRPRSTTEVVAQFPEVTRFAVMKHMDVLREAGLLLSRAEGRKRIHTLNATPIRQVYESLVSGYADLWASRLTGLKRSVESCDGVADGGAPRRRGKRET